LLSRRLGHFCGKGADAGILLIAALATDAPYPDAAFLPATFSQRFRHR